MNAPGSGRLSRLRRPLGLVAGACLSILALAPEPALAQPVPPAVRPKQPEPETHAASGATDQSPIQSQEPTLPEDPLKIPEGAAGRIGSDADPDAVEKGRASTTTRRFFGLYYSEESGDYQFKTLFPLYAERKQPGDLAQLITPLYYKRRSTDHDADVIFPLFWNLRDHDMKTTIVGPFMHRRSTGRPGAPARSDTWLAPLAFHGESEDGSGYFHLPPLLTFSTHDRNSGFQMAGPLFCKWKGGRACDARSATEMDLGVAPFYFWGKTESTEYELMPPLLHYYRYDEAGESSLNVWGPYVRQHSRDKDSLWVLPLFYRSWGKNESSTTLFPFFHHSESGLSRLTISPLFVDSKSEDGSETFVTWGYARHRGRTELDMITPFYWEYRDPDIGLERQFLFPFYYRNRSPRGDDLVVAPFFARFQEPKVSTSTWITPLFRYKTDITGWQASLFPLFHVGRENQSSHFVLAPFIWDFASPKSRSTVVLPFFYRFEDEETISQLVLNTYYREKKGTKEWEFHFFPFVNFGQTTHGHYWNILYGLAGYSQDGSQVKVKALYLPISLSE